MIRGHVQHPGNVWAMNALCHKAEILIAEDMSVSYEVVVVGKPGRIHLALLVVGPKPVPAHVGPEELGQLIVVGVEVLTLAGN